MKLDPVISGYMQTYLDHNTKARDQIDRLAPEAAGAYLRGLYEEICRGLWAGDSSKGEHSPAHGTTQPPRRPRPRIPGSQPKK